MKGGGCRIEVFIWRLTSDGLEIRGKAEYQPRWSLRDEEKAELSRSQWWWRNVRAGP